MGYLTGTPYTKQFKYPEWYKIPWCLPEELPGSIQEKKTKCGKQNCRCSSGIREDRHTAYYRVWYQDGKQKSKYIRKADLESVREKIDARNTRLDKQRAERNKHMRRGDAAGLTTRQRIQIGLTGDHDRAIEGANFRQLMDMIDMLI